MISINTNLSSLITQTNLAQSTLSLNQAIERMSTGFKINHAKDNAANHSIATNLSTKISAYQVAEDNASMGLDMVNTATSTLSIIENSLTRARALCVQAQNGTYGTDSIKAIRSELSSLVDELIRTKENTEFNGINLFGKEGMPVANPETGFIADVVTQTPDVTVSDPTKLLEAIENNSIIGISNAQTLAELANIVNNDLHSCEGKTIVLTNDIDLSAYSNWTPIGWYDSADLDHHVFKGDFNGNGHTISNLTITSAVLEGVGLFGCIQSGAISNLGLSNINILANVGYVGGILGCYVKSDVVIDNCFVNGAISGGNRTGLIAGCCEYANNCYSEGSVNSVGGGYFSNYGGLIGAGGATNSYSTADVSGYTGVGGLIGYCARAYNCYAMGNVNATLRTNAIAGGLAGSVGFGTIKNCYATGNVTSAGNMAGGLIGKVTESGTVSVDLVIENCYATGDVDGKNNIGGLIGTLSNLYSIKNCYATGTVSATGSNVGDLVGENNGEVDSISSKIDTDTLNKYIEDGILLSLNSNTSGANLTFQIGINDDVNSSLALNFEFITNDIFAIRRNVTSSYTLLQIDNILSKISAKQTEFGATSNRLESALEEISIQYENLVSSRSTIKDADIAEESSEYIKYQILQQASATLLATANQTPAIALQLI